jgi:hypothetical protein
MSALASVAARGFSPDCASTVVIRNDRFTSTPAVAFAQIAVIRRRRGQ